MRKLLTRLAMKLFPEDSAQAHNARLQQLVDKLSELSLMQEEEIHILRKRLGLALGELNKLRAELPRKSHMPSTSEVDTLIGEMRR